MNGANRLGGNSLSDLLVFGKRAGECAAQYGAQAPEPGIDEAQTADAAAEMTRYLSARATRTPTGCTTSSRTRCSKTSASSATRPG